MAIDLVSAARLMPAATSAAAQPGSAAAGAAAGATFGESLQGLLSAVDTSAGAANAAVADMVTGTGDVHQAMIALQEADLALQLTVQIRNKLVQAYQDVMRMSI